MRLHVALSGGVDSSVAALLLAKQFGKQNVVGVHMANWAPNARCQEESWNDVQRVADQIGIACTRVSCEREYWIDVFEPMLDAYTRGLTPNPDVACNRSVKFGALLDKIPGTLATGHYVSLARRKQVKLIARPFDLSKDQSYYLSTVDPSVWDRIIFPLAGLTKPVVREIARQNQLLTAEKPDSQGLCFVDQKEYGQNGFTKFLGEYIEPKPGPIYTYFDRTTVLGTHSGLYTHTIGQRVRASIPQSTHPGKWFVCGKDEESNALIIARSAPLSRRVYVDMTWHKPPDPASVLHAQHRSLQKPLEINRFKLEGESTQFEFAGLSQSVAPGQYLVVYENNAVIGAGIILHADTT